MLVEWDEILKYFLLGLIFVLWLSLIWIVKREILTKRHLLRAGLLLIFVAFVIINFLYFSTNISSIAGIVLPIIWTFLDEKLIPLEKIRVVLILKSTTGYSKAIADAIKDNMSKGFPKVSLEIPKTGNLEDVSEQLVALRTALSTHPDIILIIPPPEKESLIPHVIDAISSGTPIITIDQKFEADRFLEKGLLPPLHIGCNNVAGGKLAAQIIISALKGKGDIAIISGPTDSNPSRDRMLAFIEEILNTSPELNLVALKKTNWGVIEADQKMDELLREEKRIDAVFCCNDRLALGALNCLRKKNHIGNPPIVVGYDGIPEIQEPIKQGEILASIDQHIYAQAELVSEQVSYILNNRRDFIKKHYAEILVHPSAMTKEILIEQDAAV